MQHCGKKQNAVGVFEEGVSMMRDGYEKFCVSVINVPSVPR